MNFLTPYWPLLLALALPLLVHFWNKQKVTRIPFGSVKYLQQIKKNHWYRIRLSDLPLLLLRLVLFALLAFLLMQPIWQQIQQPQAQTRLYISPDLLPAKQYSIVQELLDSIPKEQLQLQLLYPGFPSIENPDTSLQLVVDQQVNYWHLLQSVAAQIIDEKDLTCYAFASDLLKNYQGKKPQIQGDINLYQLPVKTTRKWLVNVKWQGQQEVLLTVGKSNAEQTNYLQQKVDLKAGNHTTEIKDWGTLSIQQKSPSTWQVQDKEGLLVDTLLQAPSQIQVPQITVFYSTTRQADQRHIMAALKAIDQVHQVPYSIKALSTNKLPQHQDKSQFYIWLSPDTVPQKLLDQVQAGAILLADATGKKMDATEQLIFRSFENSHAPPRLLEKTTKTLLQGTPIWQDGTGSPILSRQAIGQGWQYDFVGRFVASSTSMVNDGILASWLYDLLLQNDQVNAQQFASLDSRASFASQIKPIQKAKVTQEDTSITSLVVEQRLHFFWWVLVAILFIFERGWAERKRE